MAEKDVINVKGEDILEIKSFVVPTQEKALEFLQQNVIRYIRYLHECRKMSYSTIGVEIGYSNGRVHEIRFGKKIPGEKRLKLIYEKLHALVTPLRNASLKKATAISNHGTRDKSVIIEQETTTNQPLALIPQPLGEIQNE